MGDLDQAQERRTHPRIRVRIESQLSAPGGKVRGHLLDLSAGGAYLSTPRLLPIGTGVHLSIPRGAARNPLELDAEVVRIGDPREGRISGLGLRFLGLSPLEAELLRSMLVSAAA